MGTTRQPGNHMQNRSSRSRVAFRSVFALAALIPFSLGAMKVAHADDLLGLYLGAAYGQAHIRAQLDNFPPDGIALGEFDATHSAYQAMIGIRALHFLGAEITYMDLGQSSVRVPSFAGVATGGQVPSSNIPITEQTSQKGEGAFALLYLPVPIVDVYVKAGISRITTDSSVAYTIPGAGTCAIGHPNCAVFSAARSATDTSFAYGAGLQWKLGQWAVRGEYEGFDAAGAHPGLFSIGMTYWIL